MIFRKRDPTPYHSSPEVWDKLKPLARQNRHEPTIAEQRLWACLRNRQIAGLKIRRQYTIDKFIADFCCLERRLIIEVDGSIHQYTIEEDAIRQEFLEAIGFRVLRFTNDEVNGTIEDVLRTITQTAAAITHDSPPSPPLQHYLMERGTGGEVQQ